MKNFQEEDQILFEAIEAYRNGDGGKATFIYESTKKYTYKIVHQEVERFKSQSILTGDAISITEDVMQDLYLNFFNNIAKFRNEDPRSIFKWISIVSHRMLLDYVDRNKMEVLQFEKDEDYREDNDIWDASEINDSDMESHHELLPEAALEDKEFRQLIMDFVQSLPEAQAQTVLLHFRGGMKYQEIADEMGVSLITVKTRMKKAKDSLEEIITKYEKKTGTKLHSVSILPLLWLLYRMSSESTTVPVAVDTTVTSSIAEASSLAGASGVGIGGATTVGSVATKAISTRVLVAIVSTAVAIGGVAVGSQIVEKKQETSVEQGDLEENGADDNQNDDESDTSSKTDTDTSNTNGEPTDSTINQSNQNETAGGNDTNSDNNVTQEGNGVGNNTNETGNASGNGNTSSNDGTGGSGDNSGNEGTGGSENNTENGNNSANEDTSESTATKGTKENPYRIGEKIVISNAAGYSSSDTSSYDVEITVTDYTVPKLENAVYVTFSNTEMILNILKAKVKITRDSTEAFGQAPFALGLLSEDEKGNVQSGYLNKQDGNIITNISNNVEYDIGFHMTTSAFNEELTYSYLRISYKNLNNSYSYIYLKLE